jgi:hypothetical protein
MATKKKTPYETNPLYKGRAKCTCIDKFNKELVAQGHNTQVISTLFTGKCALAVEKVDTKNRKKPLTVLANFCPLCGMKYPDGG